MTGARPGALKLATEQELQRRRVEAARARDEARKQAARNAGHPEWADLPAHVDVARMRKVPQYFTGRQCPEGHVAPNDVRTRKCTACRDAPARPRGRPRLRPKDDRTVWEQRFDRLAQKIAQTGRLHHLGGNGMIRATTKVVDADPWEACRRAAKLTDETGELHCLVPRKGGFIVKKNRRCSWVKGIDTRPEIMHASARRHVMSRALVDVSPTFISFVAAHHLQHRVPVLLKVQVVR
jgi:hypothetical protein